MMTSNLTKILRPFSKAVQGLLPNSSHVKSTRVILAINEEIDFDRFLDLLIYYMCARCHSDTSKNYRRHADWFPGHHNGLFTISLSRAKIDNLYAGIMNSYRIYLQHKENPINIEEPLAQAFFESPMPLFPNDNLHRTTKYFFSNRRNNFVRHGLENLQKSEFKLGQSFPPKFSMQEVSVSIDGVSFAVELDRAPLARCFSHGQYRQWHYCGGVISLKDFKKLGGKLSLSGDRDHFYARSNIEISNWYFLYRAEAEQPGNLEFSANLMRHNIRDIKSSGVGNIEINTLRKFLAAVDMLEQRIEAFELLSD